MKALDAAGSKSFRPTAEELEYVREAARPLTAEDLSDGEDEDFDQTWGFSDLPPPILPPQPIPLTAGSAWHSANVNAPTSPPPPPPSTPTPAAAISEARMSTPPTAMMRASPCCSCGHTRNFNTFERFV